MQRVLYRSLVIRLFAISLLALSLSACGASIPARDVLERDVGDFRYRRYQHVLDVEFPVEGNSAEGHTASYVRRGSGDETAIATAFVTHYEHAASLTADIADVIRTLSTYSTSVADVGPGYAWSLEGPAGDKWIMWVSRDRVVKLGAPPGEDVPEDLLDIYMDIYPSDLDEQGRARDGADSAGASHRAATETEETELPASLREGAPR